MKSYSAKQTHLHNYQPIQTQRSFSQPNNMVLDLQHTFGNRATTQFMLSKKPNISPPVIQRAINPDLVNQHKQKLGIPIGEKIKILECPLDSNLKITDKVEKVPAEHRLNMEGLEDEEIGKILFGELYEKSKSEANMEIPNIVTEENKEKVMKQQELKNEAKDWLNSPFSLHLSLHGNAAYSYLYKVVAITQRQDDPLSQNKYNRDLLHEIGHFKQDISKNQANGANTNIKILEYHNIILHENLYSDTNLRIKYSNNADKDSGKSWDDMCSELELSPTNNALIKEMDESLKSHEYQVAEKIRQNLVNEYFYGRK
ncbi:hypothetical protein [Paenibacillus wenxiniae]|uniref:IrrE N-terminal-like domain-containing protein n=1 Tax=Paenibacillus wenxiniae TaxID=1636843 RepID=A0ABW4REJ7_9BACL